MTITTMPLISRGSPATSNDDFSGIFLATLANNAAYGGQNYYRCQTTPAGNANSGTLTQAVYLAYDLSGVPSSQRQNVVVVWYNDPTTDPYNSALIFVNYFNVAANYTIDTNTAAGGSYPASGWSTQATVTNNPYHSRQHAINMAGANWIRINVTSINGSVANNNVSLNMDVHDAHMANNDNWIFYGDSITQRGLDHDDIALGPILAAQINAKVANFPVMENGGIGGFSAADGAANISTWLSVFSGKYVALNYGTNDANGGGSLVTNFSANMTTMINAVIGAGKTPVIPKIPWGGTAGLLANVQTLNAVISTLYNTFPSIVHGPDLYSYFNANQGLISGDNIHPTDPAGYTAYRAQWATALLNNVYVSGQTVLRPRGLHIGKVA